MPSRIQIENTYLLPGLFKERADINRAYLMELKMVRLADCLFCFTGAYEYLDYIENNLLYQAHSNPVAIGSIFAYNCTERDCFFHKGVI